MNSEHFKAIIEISAENSTVKYEINDSGELEVDRFLSVSMRYPCNYGFLPGTLGGDGDPLDVLLVSSAPIMPGAAIKCRVIGMLEMEDEGGKDEKIMALPLSSADPFYANVDDVSLLGSPLLNKISHFFEKYKDLDEGKWAKIGGWFGRDVAENIVKKSLVGGS